MTRWRFGAGIGLAFVMIGAVVGAEPAPQQTAAPPKPEITLKLRILCLKSAVAEVNAEPDEAALKKMVEEINRIWAPANIRFTLDSVKRVDARDEEAQRDYAKLCGQRDVVGILARLLTRMVPELKPERGVFHIIFVHRFPANFGGRYFPELGMVVTPQRVVLRPPTAPPGKADALIERPLEPKVMAHELGHALSLMHVNLDENLMCVGRGARDPKKAIKLTEEQIASARKIASEGKPFTGAGARKAREGEETPKKP